MTHWKSAILCCAVVGVTAGYVVRHRQPQSPQSSEQRPIPKRLACYFEPGDKLAFRLQSGASVLEPNNESPRKLDLDAVMWWRVAEARGAAGWVVAAELSKVTVYDGGGEPSAAASAPYLTPIVFQIGTDCRFRSFAFPPGATEESKQKLERLFASMQIVLSPLPVVEWVSQHQDELGVAQVSYTADKRLEEPRLTLRRLRYANTVLPWIPQFGGRLDVEILESVADGSLEATGRFLRELSGREKVRFSIGARQFSEITTTTQLARINSGEEPPASLDKIEAGQFVIHTIKKESVSTEPREVAAPDPVLAVMDVTAVLADFTTLLTRTSDGLFRATERLASYLSANPKAIEDLVSRIRTGSIPDKLHAPLFLALERTGTLAAEKALSAVLRDRGMSTKNRMRAAAALQDIPKPSAATAKTLIDQSRILSSSQEERMVSSAALLALGALSHRTVDRQPALAQTIREELGQRLGSTKDEAEREVLLDAVGNSGDTALIDSIQPSAADSSPAIRARAAQAHRRMPVEKVEPLLAAWLGKESDATVRRSIGSAIAEGLFAEHKGAASSTVSVALAQLPQEKDARLRAVLIGLLGSAASSAPEAKRGLISHFPRETVAELKVLIGRFVTAEELRSQAL